MNDNGSVRTTTATATLSVSTNGVTNIQLVDDSGDPIETDVFLVEVLGGAELCSIEYDVSATASVSDNTITTSATLA